MQKSAKLSLSLAAALGLALIAPKAAHAVAAALVQVTNTLTNPAGTMSTHKAASQLVQLAAPGGSLIAGYSTVTLAQFNTAMTQQQSIPYVVPQGQSLVITDLDFDINGANSEVGILLSNGNVPPQAFGQYYERYDFDSFTNGFAEELIHLESGIVYPAGSTVAVTIAGNLSNGGVTAVLRGYLTPQ